MSICNSMVYDRLVHMYVLIYFLIMYFFCLFCLFFCFKLSQSNGTRPCGVFQGWVALLILILGCPQESHGFGIFPASAITLGLHLTWRVFPVPWSAPKSGEKRYMSNRLASSSKAGCADRSFSEIVASKSGAVSRLPNVYVSSVSQHRRRRWTCLPMMLGDHVELSGTDFSSELSFSLLPDEVKWGDVDSCWYLPYRIPNYVQPQENPWES